MKPYVLKIVKKSSSSCMQMIWLMNALIPKVLMRKTSALFRKRESLHRLIMTTQISPRKTAAITIVMKHQKVASITICSRAFPIVIAQAMPWMEPQAAYLALRRKFYSLQRITMLLSTHAVPKKMAPEWAIPSTKKHHFSKPRSWMKEPNSKMAVISINIYRLRHSVVVVQARFSFSKELHQALLQALTALLSQIISLTVKVDSTQLDHSDTLCSEVVLICAGVFTMACRVAARQVGR